MENKDNTLEAKPYVFTTDEYLSALFSHPGNIDLYNKIVGFCEKQGTTKTSDQNLVARKILDETFDILEIIYTCHEQHFKVVDYIKGFFKQWELSMAELFRELILLGLADKRRFDFNSTGLTFLRKKIPTMDIAKIHADETIQIHNGWLEYFSDGYSKGKCISYEAVVNGFLTVRGQKQTEEERVRDFIKAHSADTVMKEASRMLSKKSKPDPKIIIKETDSFERYLTEEGKEILPELIAMYGNKNHSGIKRLHMIAALDKVGLLLDPGRIFKDNLADLHSALEKTFGSAGALKTFYGNVTNVTYSTNAEYYEEAVEDYRNDIAGIRTRHKLKKDNGQ